MTPQKRYVQTIMSSFYTPGYSPSTGPKDCGEIVRKIYDARLQVMTNQKHYLSDLLTLEEQTKECLQALERSVRPASLEDIRKAIEGSTNRADVIEALQIAGPGIQAEVDSAKASIASILEVQGVSQREKSRVVRVGTMRINRAAIDGQEAIEGETSRLLNQLETLRSLAEGGLVDPVTIIVKLAEVATSTVLIPGDVDSVLAEMRELMEHQSPGTQLVADFGLSVDSRDGHIPKIISVPEGWVNVYASVVRKGFFRKTLKVRMRQPDGMFNDWMEVGVDFMSKTENLCGAVHRELQIWVPADTLVVVHGIAPSAITVTAYDDADHDYEPDLPYGY